MYLKYIILMCSAFYIPAVKSITENQIRTLFDEIRDPDHNYVTYADMVHHYIEDDNPEFLRVTRTYGNNKNADKEDRMNYGQFRNAAYLGYIPRYYKKEILKVFNEIRKSHNPYVTYQDLVKYYKHIDTAVLEAVTSNFGKATSDGLYVLNFTNFKRAINTGALPNPELEK